MSTFYVTGNFRDDKIIPKNLLFYMKRETVGIRRRAHKTHAPKDLGP